MSWIITWTEPEPVEVPQALREFVGGHALVAQVLARRGYRDLQDARGFLDSEAYLTHPPEEMPGMVEAVGRLEQAIRRGENICVWGDFDVDGQTATTLLVDALRGIDARVVYHIPVRANESHGVNLPNLEKVIAQGAQLVLTCDTGIAAHEAVAYAHERGVDVIVTDHHALPPELPPAQAVVNPRLLPTGHPLGNLPGVGVAYKLAQALYARLGRSAEMEGYLDLVALGVVADLAHLYGDTRYLLQRGLSVLRNTSRAGLQIMYELAGLDPTYLGEEHIGFIIGPRLNALGRLADANPIVEFLTTANKDKARLVALQLEALNAQRRLLTEQVYRGAQSQIERDPALLEGAALVLSHPTWPAGVIGIVASRLVERYQKPVVLLTAPEGGTARGSARSVEGVDITAAIASQAELLVGYGGHPMAAGLAIETQRIPQFRRGLAREVDRMQVAAPPEPSLAIDGYIPFSELSLELVADLERLAPFGPGNPPLTLASRNLHLVSQRAVGRSGEHLLLVVEDETGASGRAIWWQGSEWLEMEPLPDGPFDLAYTVRASTYRGQRDVQIEWVSARPREGDLSLIQLRSTPEVVVDYRQEAYPLLVLHRLQAEGDLLIWAEAEAKAKLDARDRNELIPAERLAIWTTPAGHAELEAVMQAVSPQTVYLFGIDPVMDQAEKFLKRLAGLVKYALRARLGQASLSALAAATAQREPVVLMGLTWLEASGHVRVEGQSMDEITLVPGSRSEHLERDQVNAQLVAMLRETAAYRAYFMRADKERLLGAA